MSGMSLLTFIVVFLVVLYVNEVVAVENEVEVKRDDNNRQYSPFWFGPRVGRKKRNPGNEILWNADREELESLLDFIKSNPWVILRFNKDKNHASGYNQKFGKESSDDISDEVIGDLVQRSMFAPRLGRNAFFPRLGRENEVP